eukprot:Plantae.Rhodophyta-Rhodochaete_pulchella.ctg11167.p2 GENE.Plantae.Rhodophyta-Rhodochaete_pulchella.ctg11167~~Plantae.Rhodophyta-Rhodochaete_pulchella.ctg11167.p2  ORF type:complete len:239 (+),score=21.43 Plantae.Rhodophyta-Rhodochaete_pulchella.ctg11167:514-1230(+)
MPPTEVTLEDRVGLLFFTTAIWAFQPMFAALYSYPRERAILNKDRASGTYRLSAYMCAKAVVELPLEMVYPVMYVTIVWWMSNANPSFGRFVLAVVTVLSHVVLSNSMGVFISTAIPDLKKAQVLTVLLVLSSMLLGGFYVSPARYPSWLRRIQWLSFIRYCYVSLLGAEVRGREYACVDNEHTNFSNGGTNCPVTDDNVFSTLGVDPAPGIWGSIGVLLLFSIVVRLSTYFLLRIRR